jgi:hypothetical protein
MGVVESKVLQVQVFDKDMIGSDDLIGSVPVSECRFTVLEPHMVLNHRSGSSYHRRNLVQLALEMKTEIPCEMAKDEPQTEEVEEQEQKQKADTGPSAQARTEAQVSRLAEKL